MDQFSRFRRLRDGRQRWLNHLNFLLVCKKNKVIPNFIKIKCNIPSSYRIKKTLRRLHFIVLRAVIKDTRSKLAYVESQLYLSHLYVSNSVEPIMWNYLDGMSAGQSSKLSCSGKRKHLMKFSNLKLGGGGDGLKALTDKQVELINNPKVLNLSGVDVNTNQCELLSLGLNFSLKSKKADDLEVVANVERAFKYSKLKFEQKDFLRQKLVQVLEFNNKGCSNLSVGERADLNCLKNRKDLVITTADKGGAVVILSALQYRSGIESLLLSKDYSVCKKSVLDNLMGDVKRVIRDSSIIEEAKKRALIPSYYQPGRLYISPKIHKPVLAFRPIISSVNTPTYALAKCMAKMLSPLCKLNPFSVLSSHDFVCKLNECGCEGMVMFSFDVVSMFTCIPVQGALSALYNRLNKLNYSSNEINDIIRVVEVCTRPAIFCVNDKIFQQDRGLPMGGCLSPILCDLYMWELEDKLGDLDCKPVFWKRYVDDVFTLFHKNQLEVYNIADILGKLNELDDNVQFTVESEVNDCLAFLDIEISKNVCNDQFITSIYRKPFSVALPPHCRSAHPFSQKMSAFYYYVFRAFRLCSNEDLVNNELNFLKHVAVDRGFSANIIDCLARKIKIKLNHPSTMSTLREGSSRGEKPILLLPQNNPGICKIMTLCNKYFRCISKPRLKISNFIFPPKEDLCATDRPGVYFISCECGRGYVGQTCRALRYRISEHKTNVKFSRVKNSNIAAHVLEEGHVFDFRNAKLIKITTDWSVLNTYESANIIKYKEQLINDQHYPFMSTIWSPIIQKMSSVSPWKEERSESPSLKAVI